MAPVATKARRRLSASARTRWRRPTGTAGVAIDGNEHTRRRLNTENPTAPLAFPVNGQSLTITIDPGKFGPIRDWVVLTRPLILIAQP